MRVEIQGLVKEYKGGTRALQGVDLQFGEGTLGLLGPNGAGKTTLMRILATLLSPTAGEVVVDGEELARNRAAIRSRLGYLPQAFGAPRSVRVQELVDTIARCKGVPRGKRSAAVKGVLETVGLYDVRHRKIKQLSGGMLRRVGIAQALVGDPDLLIVDEPTVGLDPEERVRFRQVLQDQSERMTVLLSTHIVADLSATCSDIAVLDVGRIQFRGSPEELRARAQGSVWEKLCPADEVAELEESYTVVSSLPREGAFRVRGVGPSPTGAEAVPAEKIGLEDAYLHLVGKGQEVLGEADSPSMVEGGAA